MKKLPPLSFRHAFSLFEVMIYAGLIAVFLGLSLLSAGNVITSQKALTSSAEILANREFIERKLFWILNQSQTVSSPAPNASSSSVTLRTVSSSADPAVISLSGNTLSLSLAGAPATPLNNNRVAVDSFTVLNVSNFQTTSSLDVSFKISDAKNPKASSSVSFSFTLK